MTAPLAASPLRIAVLLDGDADFFHLSLLSQGHIGGRLAAEQLHTRVVGLFTSAQPVELMCMVFWNLAGLSSYLSFTDQVAPSALESFVQGFSTFPLGCCSAVDTGRGKQAADRALKRHLALLIPIFDHLLLGGTHDAGYASTLSSLGAELSSKISLLQTTPAFSPALEELGMKRFDLRDWGLFDGRDPNNGKRHLMPSELRGQGVAAGKPVDDLTTPFTPLISHLSLHTDPSPPLNDVLGALGAQYGSPTALYPPSASSVASETTVPQSWKEYLEAAREEGVVEVGGRRGARWIRLVEARGGDGPG